MADLGYTNATWLRFFRELGVFLRIMRVVEEQRRRVTRERIQVRNLGDVTSATPHFTDVTVTTFGAFGTSSNEEGRIYVRFVANGGNWDVHFYRSTGAANEVGTITNVAASATGTIVEANSSGFAGTATLGAAIAGDTSDKHQLLILPDWKRESLILFPSDGTTDDDTHSRAAYEGLLGDLASLYERALAQCRVRLAQWAISAPRNTVARGADFLSERVLSLISEAPDQDSDGAVDRILSGFFPVLEQAMADETTGSTQDIIRRVVASTSVTFGTNNTGSGTMATPTPGQRAPLGTFTGKCVSGLGTGDGGAEEFEISFVGSDDNDDVAFVDPARLKIKEAYVLPRGGGTVTLVRSFTKTGDAGNADAGAASTFTFTGESEDNTDSGALYATVAANGSNWNFLFYSTSARNTGDLVAQATNVATAAAAQATPRNGSGLYVNFTVGSGPTDTNTFTIDGNFFSTDNAASVQDDFRFTTSLTSSGVAARLLAELFVPPAQLNEIAAGPQIEDEVLGKANTDLNFITDDI